MTEKTDLHPRAAREKIIEVANEVIAARPRGGHMLSMKDINLAVCIVRRQRLVDDETLKAAGFKAHGQ